MKEYREHYSTQTGHLLRGEANKATQKLEKLNPGMPIPKPTNLPMSIESMRILRKSMRRVTRDGRR